VRVCVRFVVFILPCLEETLQHVPCQCTVQRNDAECAESEARSAAARNATTSRSERAIATMTIAMKTKLTQSRRQHIRLRIKLKREKISVGLHQTHARALHRPTMTSADITKTVA
jgi:hypothetical protein